MTRKAALLLVVIITALSAAMCGQSLAECKAMAARVDKVGRNTLQVNMGHQMAGTLMTRSTDAGRCTDAHARELSAHELEELDWVVYTLDAQIMARMWNFITEHHLGRRFNEEDAGSGRAGRGIY